MTDGIVVQFEHASSGVAELSWKQAEIWSVMQGKGSFLPMEGVRPRHIESVPVGAAAPIGVVR